MVILLFFAFISGLVTIAAPCIWPLLPIILSSSSTSERRKPFGITLGIITSFAIFTLTISYIVRIIPFDINVLRLFAVIVIGFLGVTLVIPQLSQLLEGYVSRLSGRFVPINGSRHGFWGGYITGFALGIVWSPCAGPILATIATIAATRAVSFEVILVTVAYVVGVGIPLFIFATAGSYLFTKTRVFSRYTGRIQQVFGILMILTAVSIYTNYDKVLQVKLLDVFPSYSQFLYKLEGSEKVKTQLDLLKEKKEDMKKSISIKADLQDMGPAPEFVGISKWLNSKPLTMVDLRGKVVLIDFWTYTCINCIRTLPHVTGWYEKYKDKGFVVVGVHTPEFEFEKKMENVLAAMKQYKINYPVAQDNDYATWNAYDNHYWPAEYLIDARGNIRHVHFGEGEYDTTEAAIQKLLEEAGQTVSVNMTKVEDQTPRDALTPETYLGSRRIERFSSPETISGTSQEFTIPQDLNLHSFAFGGNWTIEEEQAVVGKGATLEIQFYAGKVFLVITPQKKGDVVSVLFDGTPVDKVILDKPRLYSLIDLKGKVGEHRLRLKFPLGTAVYAFTFGS